MLICSSLIFTLRIMMISSSTILKTEIKPNKARIKIFTFMVKINLSISLLSIWTLSLSIMHSRMVMSSLVSSRKKRWLKTWLTFTLTKRALLKISQLLALTFLVSIWRLSVWNKLISTNFSKILMREEMNTWANKVNQLSISSLKSMKTLLSSVRVIRWQKWIYKWSKFALNARVRNW